MSALSESPAIPSFWRPETSEISKKPRPNTTVGFQFDNRNVGTSAPSTPAIRRNNTDSFERGLSLPLPSSKQDTGSSVLDPDGDAYVNRYARPVTAGSIYLPSNYHKSFSPNTFSGFNVKRSASKSPKRSANGSTSEDISIEGSPSETAKGARSSFNSNFRTFDIGSERRRRILEASQDSSRPGRYSYRTKSASPALIDTSTLDSRLNFTMGRLERSIAQLSKNTMRAVSHLENPPKDITLPKLNVKNSAWPLQPYSPPANETPASSSSSTKARPVSVPDMSSPVPASSVEYESLKAAVTYSPSQNPKKVAETDSESRKSSFQSSYNDADRPFQVGAQTQSTPNRISRSDSPIVYDVDTHSEDNASTASSEAISQSMRSFQPQPNTGSPFPRFTSTNTEDEQESDIPQSDANDSTVNLNQPNYANLTPTPQVSPKRPTYSRSSPLPSASVPALGDGSPDPPAAPSIQNSLSVHESEMPPHVTRDYTQPAASATPVPKEKPSEKSEKPPKKKGSKLEKFCCILM
ncbi:Cell polarity protein mod5 [Schizosaccharomyces pombe]